MGFTIWRDLSLHKYGHLTSTTPFPQHLQFIKTSGEAPIKAQVMNTWSTYDTQKSVWFLPCCRSYSLKATKCKITRRTQWWRLEDLKWLHFRDIFVFVMYYVYGVSGPSLLIESTDSMIEHFIFTPPACCLRLVITSGWQIDLISDYDICAISVCTADFSLDAVDLPDCC